MGERIDRGYSTGAEMALEMLQAGEGSTAVFTRERFSVSGTLLLDFCRFLILHIEGVVGVPGGSRGERI
jgi:hypothetical protein